MTSSNDRVLKNETEKTVIASGVYSMADNNHTMGDGWTLLMTYGTDNLTDPEVNTRYCNNTSNSVAVTLNQNHGYTWVHTCKLNRNNNQY